MLFHCNKTAVCIHLLQAAVTRGWCAILSPFAGSILELVGHCKGVGLVLLNRLSFGTLGSLSLSLRVLQCVQSRCNCWKKNQGPVSQILDCGDGCRRVPTISSELAGSQLRTKEFFVENEREAATIGLLPSSSHSFVVTGFIK